MQDQRLWEAILAAPVDITSGPGEMKKTVRQSCRLNEREYQHVLREYQKFLYLLTVTGENLRPSKVVDFIWQTHASDPVPRPHRQTSPPFWPPKYVERSRPLSWDRDYEATLQRYDQVFGPTPSQLIWPTVRRLRALVLAYTSPFVAVPVMAAGLEAGGHWEVLFPIGLIVLICVLSVAFMFDPWGDRSDP
jgi:hypothetical protein